VDRKINPRTLLAKAKSVRQELALEVACEDPPKPIRDNLEKVRAERKASAKEKILGNRRNRKVTPKVTEQSATYKAKTIEHIQGVAITKKVKRYVHRFLILNKLTKCKEVRVRFCCKKRT
jgi:hypothetical protein